MVLLLAASAYADDGRAGARALQRGRKLEAKGDHAGALKAYNEALDAMPDDPSVLSEISVSALATGELDRARKAATLALASKDLEPRLQAAIDFNLGQIEEKAKNGDNAIAAYRAAMDACPIAAARARLVKLAPRVASEIDTLEAIRPDGPYATLAKAGAATKCTVTDGAFDDKKTDTDPRGPFLAVRNLSCEDNSGAAPANENSGRTLGVAMQLKSGWYVVASAKDEDGAANNSGSFSLTSDWPGFGPVLEWRGTADHHHVSHSREGADIEGYSNTSLLLCAVDHTRAPFCLPAFAVDGSDFAETNLDDGEGGVKSSDVQVDTHWSIDVKEVAGGIEVVGKGDCSLLPGRHPVELP